MKPHILIDATFDPAKRDFPSYNGFLLLKVFRNGEHYETYSVLDVERERQQWRWRLRPPPPRLHKKLDRSSFAAPPIIIVLYFHQILDVNNLTSDCKFAVIFKNIKPALKNSCFLLFWGEFVSSSALHV